MIEEGIHARYPRGRHFNIEEEIVWNCNRINEQVIQRHLIGHISVTGVCIIHRCHINEEEIDEQSTSSGIGKGTGVKMASASDEEDPGKGKIKESVEAINNQARRRRRDDFTAPANVMGENYLKQMST